MHDVHEFLKNLALVLCVAGLTTVLFQRLRQPIVLGYIVAGLIIGPHVPIPLVADLVTIQTLSELGVVMLMFSLGLEFSLRKLFRVGPTVGLIAIIQVSIMIWLGFAAGRAFGWTGVESLFTGALISISSTTIIAKAFEEQKASGKIREIVFGVLIVEDLVAILLIAALTTVATGTGASAGALAMTAGRLALFLVGLLVVGLLVIPRAIRYVHRLDRPEITLIASVGISFALAALAQALEYSVALGAFLAGSLVAESGHQAEIEHLVQPVRDLFAAIFFVAVGMLIDPVLIARHWGAVLALTAVVVVGKVFSVSLGAFLTGNGIRTSIQSGMSLAQIGEFSFIIAGVGLSLNATRDFLYPVAVAVSAITTLLTPWLIRASGPVASFIDRKLPRALQTFAALYGSWVEAVKEARQRQTAGARVRRLMFRVLLDAVLLLATIVGGAVLTPYVSALAEDKLGIEENVARWVTIGAIVALAIPFAIGVVRTAGSLALVLASQAMPEPEKGRADLAAAPRRVLTVTFQLAIVLIVGLPIIALTQPFLPPFRGAVVLVALLVVLGVGFWKSATNLQGHVRAGAQAIVEVLARQAQSPPEGGPEPGPDAALEELYRVLPGLGEPVPVQIKGSSVAVGKSLAEVNLRGLTGATVLVIRRGPEAIVVPSAREVLREGDIVALAGSHEAIEAARHLLSADAASAQT